MAAAFIEHTITDELIERGLAKHGISFINAINVAREKNIFPVDILSRTDHMRKIRNPFAHRKNPSHEYLFGNRFIQSQAHPATILEQDAKDALILMYVFFHATLKNGN